MINHEMITTQAKSSECPGKVRKSKQLKIKVDEEEHLSVIFK